MSETENSDALVDTPPDAEVARLDLSKYRTDTLVEQVIALISVPGAFRTVLRATLIMTFVVMITVSLVFYYSELSGIGWLVLCGYCLVIAFVFGAALGFLRVASKALRNIEAILKVILEITRNASLDYEHLRTGKKRMPSGGELIAQVYNEVVMPTIEQAVCGAFGFLGKPLLWVYRRTLGAAVRFLIKLTDRAHLSAEDEAEIQKSVSTELEDIAKYPKTIQAYTEGAAEMVTKIGGSVRRYVMWPLYIAFYCCLLLAAVPVIVLRYLATGEPAE